MSTSTPRTMLRAMLVALASIIAVFFLVTMLLAKDWRVETTRRIEAAPERVASLVTDLAAWSKWTALQVELGPQTAMHVDGTAHGIGQSITWSGLRGKGVLEVTALDASSLHYVLRSQGPDPAPLVTVGTGRIEWRAEDSGTRVTWVDESGEQGLLERWFRWFGAIQERVRSIQTASLTGLAREVESAAKVDPK